MENNGCFGNSKVMENYGKQRPTKPFQELQWMIQDSTEIE